MTPMTRPPQSAHTSLEGKRGASATSLDDGDVQGVELSDAETLPDLESALERYAERWRKKAPCPQSCWIANSRTMKAPAAKASGSASQ